MIRDKILIRSDVVRWLEENTEDWVLNLRGNEIVLLPDDAWNFLEWFDEQKE